MKIKLVLLSIGITLLMGSCGNTPGLQSGNYNFQTEIIYQKEGYTPSHGYQIFQMVYYKSGIRQLDQIGFRRQEWSNVILDSDRGLGEIEFVSQEGVNKKILEDMKPLLTEEAAKDLSRLDASDRFLVFEDAIYAYSCEMVNGEDENYHCILVKYVPNEEVSYVFFDIPYVTVNSGEWEDYLQVYTDGTICIGNIMWLNEQLEIIERAPVVNELFGYKEIQDSLCSAGLTELSENIFLIENEGKIGNVFFCNFTTASEDMVDSHWGEPQEKYLLEMDVDGEVLAVIHIDGMEVVRICGIVPKVQGEDGKYYDVLS